MTWSPTRGFFRELKYDGYSQKCGEIFGKKDEVLEGGANLWF